MKKVIYETKLRYVPNMECKTIAIDLIFIIPNNLDQIFDLDIMHRIVKTTANGYETDALFTNELDKRYIIDYSLSKRLVGKTSLLRFSLTIPKKDLVSDYSLDDAISFFKNAIFNPLADESKFNEERFLLEQRGLRTSFENSKNSIYACADRIFDSYTDPEENYHKSYEYNLNLIKTTTPEKVYQTYLECIKNNNYLLYIGGCIDEESANYIYETYFKQEKDTFTVELDYYNYAIPHKEEYYEEKFSFNQSALFIEYRIEDMKEEDIPYFSLIGNILATSENDLIFNALRIDNNLVYSSYTNRLMYAGILYIEAYLTKEDKDKAIEVIKEVFIKLHDKNFFTECFKKIKKGIELDLVRELDKKYQTLDMQINKDLQLKNLEEIRKDYESIDIDEAIKFLDRFKLTNIVFIEGCNDDKN